jgi:hypothetical protein
MDPGSKYEAGHSAVEAVDLQEHQRYRKPMDEQSCYLDFRPPPSDDWLASHNIRSCPTNLKSLEIRCQAP